LGSIPIARSINLVDAVGLTDFHPLILPSNNVVLDAVARESDTTTSSWTRVWLGRRFVPGARIERWSPEFRSGLRYQRDRISPVDPGPPRCERCEKFIRRGAATTYVF
jgi:hypothetical protein